ncbi:MAG TPA: class I SAM-dependent methyltransferase [Candidatus Angelobacter sp.]|nr:class I SAM-dependent methyltransferase [Candidatus Angelobacter sp.]
MSGKFAKLGQLARLLVRNPGEFRDRVLTILEFQADRIHSRPILNTLNADVLMQQLHHRTGIRLDEFFSEPALLEIQNQVAERKAQCLESAIGVPLFHNASLGLARFCYAVCRALQPEVVLETGIGFGVTSAFLLQALGMNGKGALWSIDLPPLRADSDKQSGILVPENLRSRWNICRGRTRDVLPGVVRGLPAIDMFLHDSLHTFRNMTFEFQTVWAHLRQGGFLLSDDVEMNRAFTSFCSSQSPAYSAVEGSARFGLAVKGTASPLARSS